MAIVRCTDTGCIENKAGECTRLAIQLDGGTCEDWVRYDTLPDYQAEYFTANEHKEKGVKYRQRKKGKLVEFGGMRFYTSNDIRESMDEAYFTEERTGILVPLKEMMEDPEEFAKIRDRLAEQPDVTELPIYDLDVHGELVPEEEQDGN